MPQDQRSQTPDYLGLLGSGSIEIEGRIAWSSNATLLVTVSEGGLSTKAIYKPRAGERPLWDFPAGLDRREVAAYVLSEELGWGLVPETVLRNEAPLGPGSLQRFVDADFSLHYFRLLEDPSCRPALIELAAFDVVANNADRKAGHCLRDQRGRIFGIDNGLCFHVEPKLRTVIWDFAGDRLTDAAREDLARISESCLDSLSDLLSQPEIEAIRARSSNLVTDGRLPIADENAPNYPWPLL